MSWFASTREGALFVGALGIFATRRIVALVDVFTLFVGVHLETVLAATLEATHSIDTLVNRVTIMRTCFAFVYVFTAVLTCVAGFTEARS